MGRSSFAPVVVALSLALPLALAAPAARAQDAPKADGGAPPPNAPPARPPARPPVRAVPEPPRTDDAAPGGPAEVLVLERIGPALRACDAGALGQELAGASSLERIAAYEAFVRACRKSPASPALYEEAALLRELVVRQLEVVGDPPPPPEGAVAELPFDLRTTTTPPARPAPTPTPARPAVRATSSSGEPGHYVHALEQGESPPSYEGHDSTSSEQRHEGFVFRVASGASYLLGNLSARASTCAECSEVESLIGTLRGAVLDTEVVLGGTLSPGVVMGLRGTVSVPPRPSFEPSPEGGEGLRPAPFVLGTVGLVFDWYPDPGGGFHMLFAPGAAFARIRDEERRMPSELLRGMVVATALGWEGWVSESWSFGLEATAELGYLVTETSASFGYFAPGSRMTLTYD